MTAAARKHSLRVTTQTAKTSDRASDNWQTPPEVLDRVRAVAPIILDPCTTFDNPVHASEWISQGEPACKYSVGGDGLAIRWISDNEFGCVYVNPPFSQVAKWADKAIAELGEGGWPIFFLCASRVDARWYRKLVAACDVEIIWNHRLRFIDPATGRPTDSAPFPVTLFGLNVSRRRCEAVFGDVARVEVPR